MSRLTGIITATDPEVRNQSLESVCQTASREQLLAECDALDHFRRTSDNLYERVRALFFLYAIHRFHLPPLESQAAHGLIPFAGHSKLLKRRFEEAIDIFLNTQAATGPNPAISSALAAAYRALGFQTLADQVRRSVRSVRGNQWMFRMAHAADHPLRIRPELLARDGAFPILRESTPVRMDLTHSGWSDIFFLGMDFPEGARVINASIDLAVRGGTGAMDEPKPPVEVTFRVIDRPVLRLASLDLKANAEIASIAEVFDFARDYLGLLKAGVIASGIVPPGLEGATQPLADLLALVTGTRGYGIEIVSQVSGIPKGSRLAVSTSLLACIISACMRATNQIHAITGGLEETDRRLVAARAILGEWLGGSGGGWQDSGGVWPGIKLIHGVRASENDPEFGVSRGCLLPKHIIFGPEQAPPETLQRLQESLVLVHGGMAQDVGPILEMVTEKYLLRSELEWRGRREAIAILDEVMAHLKSGDIRAIGACTQRNFDGPIQTIIPLANSLYTETLIARARAEFGDDFWGFWMLGGMSGGGMGFLFHPRSKASAQQRLQCIMSETKRQMEHSVPFAMEPVVYNFAINPRGTSAQILSGDSAVMPAADRETTSQTVEESVEPSNGLQNLLKTHGFDRAHHENIQADLRSGRIGLAQNRLAADIRIEDVQPGDVFDASAALMPNVAKRYRETGMAALAAGSVAVVSMAGGVGSRWTKGAGVVKALNPFSRLGGKFRSFLEVHLAKSLRTSHTCGVMVPHVVTTSYVTHQPIESYLQANGNFGYPGPLLLSPGQTVGLRMIPTERDLRFAWKEQSHQILDDQAQKVRESLYTTLVAWAQRTGEGSDYTDNLPLQCLHPAGHWYEVPNLFHNGVLLRLLEERPQLKYLMVHNIDTMGAGVDASLLGYHIEHGAALTTEVIARNLEDRGGGLARVAGRVCLVEGLALPREEFESELSYYNSATYWIDVDQLLTVMGLTRENLSNPEKTLGAVRNLAARMPTYITLKDVKKRWGKGQEDIVPVAQFEKLWGDITRLPELKCGYVSVPRPRGQQLKEPAQLDGWMRDGSAAYVECLCAWPEDSSR